MHKCFEKHSCTSSRFPIAIVNGTFFFREAKESVLWPKFRLQKSNHTLPSVCRKASLSKVPSKWEVVFWAFMDSENANNTIDWHGMWQMLRVYGVGGKLLKVQSFYIDSRACVRVGNGVSGFRLMLG